MRFIFHSVFVNRNCSLYAWVSRLTAYSPEDAVHALKSVVGRFLHHPHSAVKYVEGVPSAGGAKVKKSILTSLVLAMAMLLLLSTFVVGGGARGQNLLRVHRHVLWGHTLRLVCAGCHVPPIPLGNRRNVIDQLKVNEMRRWLRFLWNLIMCLYGGCLICLIAIFFFNYHGEWLTRIATRFPLK